MYERHLRRCESFCCDSCLCCCAVLFALCRVCVYCIVLILPAVSNTDTQQPIRGQAWNVSALSASLIPHSPSPTTTIFCLFLLGAGPLRCDQAAILKSPCINRIGEENILLCLSDMPAFLGSRNKLDRPVVRQKAVDRLYVWLLRNN